MTQRKTKSKPVPETLEQKRARDWKYILEESEHVPEPTYFFNMGDRVDIGALEDVYVVNVLENGKFYEIDFTSTDNNYGKPIRHEHCRRFVNWLDIRPYHEEQPESLIKNKDLQLSYSQRSMMDLFGKAYRFGTDFEPEYQRDYVWNLEDKVALIDSIFNNIDIGKFVFVHKGYGEKYLYEVLDGKQRMKAILDYFENRFAYQGFYFNDLSTGDQSHFENYQVSSAEVKDTTQEQVLRYFVKLNKHGKVMDKAQIEKVEKMLESL